MPEKVTPEERLVSLAIEKARKVKEALSQREPTQVIDVEHGGEMEKVKRPKAQNDTSKIDMQKEEGFGLGGAQVKKAKFSGPPREHAGYPYAYGGLRGLINTMSMYVKNLSNDPDFKDNSNVTQLVKLIEMAKEIEHENLKYGDSGDRTGISRTDEKLVLD